MIYDSIILPDGRLRPLDRVCSEYGAGRTLDRAVLCRFLAKNLAYMSVLARADEWRLIFTPQHLSLAALATCADLASAARPPWLVLEKFTQGWHVETRSFSPDVVRNIPHNPGFAGHVQTTGVEQPSATTVVRLRRPIAIDQLDCLPDLG